MDQEFEPAGESEFSHDRQTQVGKNLRGEGVFYNKEKQKWELILDEIQIQQYSGRKQAPSGEPAGASPLKRTISGIPDEGTTQNPSDITGIIETIRNLPLLGETPETTAQTITRTSTPVQTPQKPLPPPPKKAQPTLAMSTTNTIVKGPIGTMPKGFKGEPARAEKFWTDSEIYLRANRHIYTDDEGKILYFIPLCEEKAETFTLIWYKKAATSTFADFEKAFKAQFYTTDTENMARLKFQKIAQQEDKPVASYNQRFSQIADQAGITEEGALTIPY